MEGLITLGKIWLRLQIGTAIFAVLMLLLALYLSYKEHMK